MGEMSDEQFRLAKLLLEFQQIKEDGLLILDLAHAEMASATNKLGKMFEDIYAEMDEVFWELASHYDDGWDIIREMSVSQPETDTDTH
jgi:hypothetical protein